MTVIVGILALIGLAVVGAVSWAFAHGVRDGLAQWREAPPGGMSQPVPVGEPPLLLSAALPSSYQAGQLAGEVAASWHSAHRAARAAGAAGIPVSSSWAAALALGSELSQQRQEAGRAMQAAMAQVLQDNEQAVRDAAAAGGASGRRDTSNGGSGASSGGGVTDESSGNGASGSGASAGTVPNGADGDGNSSEPAAGTARPTWPAHSPSRRPPRPRPRRCTQHRPARSDERQS
ncbi:hypothetical protein [Actinomyces naeslundii]|uniref:hypothetical protein n=1 Tax=Actinomyces naeslundii TaxID=1655 RepID=UPI0009D6FF6E|nr:hypothetical protein [Actinomyces naeslundii]